MSLALPAIVSAAGLRVHRCKLNLNRSQLQNKGSRATLLIPGEGSLVIV